MTERRACIGWAERLYHARLKGYRGSRERGGGRTGPGPDHGGLEAIHLGSIQWETRRL